MTTWRLRRISDDESAGVCTLFYITRRSALSLPLEIIGPSCDKPRHT